jgi:hypothetical protein
MGHTKLSPWAEAQIAHLDEKLRWGIISAREYDRRCESILDRNEILRQRGREQEFGEKRRKKLLELKLLFEQGKITTEEYKHRKKAVWRKYGVRPPRKRREVKPKSDPSLSSGMGKLSNGRGPVFPHSGIRSDRIRGRTAYLAKKSSG